MKLAAFVILLLSASFSLGKIKNPYLNLKFDKVIIYDFSGGKDYNQYIITNGHLATSVIKKAELDKQNILSLNERLGEKKSFGGGEAACFDPHLGIVYYLNERIVAYITICLDCNVLASSLPLKAQQQGKVGEGKDAYYMVGGPSESFRIFLNAILKKYNFSHQLKYLTSPHASHNANQKQ